MRKKRVLWVGESSVLSTGYANLSKEILRRLHASNRYEICELASYVRANDQRLQEVPWLVVPVCPGSKEEAEFNSDPINQFGKFNFEKTCIQWQPDVVLDARDHWYMSYELTSPLRPFYRLIWQPACDAYPQANDWIESFMRTDAILTYTDWAADILRKQGGGLIPVRGAAPLGADFSVFRPFPRKKEHKKTASLPADSLIIGTVMRNQTRKLYPNLFRVFRQFLDTSPLGSRALLYAHSFWPDIGWNFPELLKEFGLTRKVLFTYRCVQCGFVTPDFFSYPVITCRNCGSMSAQFINTSIGVNTETLAGIYNLFDVYVQYANSEGCGIPIVEAAACGVPTMAVDYSGMSDYIRRVGGTPIKVAALHKEQTTQCMRAIPDDCDFLDKLNDILRLPDCVRQKKGFVSRQQAMENCNWDKSAKIWMEVIDSMPPPQRSWNEPAQFKQAQELPELPYDQLVKAGLGVVAHRPDLIDTLTALRILRDLNYGKRVDVFPHAPPYTRKEFLEECEGMLNASNRWEELRCKKK